MLNPERSEFVFDIDLKVVSEGYDGIHCWFQPRAGAIPSQDGRPPSVVLTMQKYLLKHPDSFGPLHSQHTQDFGQSWSPLIEHADTLGRHDAPDGQIEGICDFTPKWHAGSGNLIGTGDNILYRPDESLAFGHPRRPAWSVYQPESESWKPWQYLKMPADPKFWDVGAGCTQRVDLPGGDILLPVYGRPQGQIPYYTTILRCRYVIDELTFCECGEPATIDIERGLYEPSLAALGGRFYLTMRNDLAAYYALSDDGLNYSAPQKWTFDDGAELGSCNTQAHWVTHSDGLFLTYTRRGAGNDNVFRYRAPLFIARVAQEGADKLVLLRHTERILVPNNGAQLGNFGVVDVNENESWVVTSEGMAPDNPSQYGSDGRVYIARLLWDKQNVAWDRH